MLNASRKPLGGFGSKTKNHFMESDFRQMEEIRPQRIKPRDRRKLYHAVCLYTTFFAIGCFCGQVGPALVDIQSITGVGLEKGSWIVTSRFIGYTLGTILNGVLYHRSNITVMFSVCLLLICTGFISIPFCPVFCVTVAVFLSTGVLQGLLDTAGNAEILQLWRRRSRISVIILHSCFYFGAVISPLYTAPFLSIIDVTNRSSSQRNTSSAYDYVIRMNTSATYSDSISESQGFTLLHNRTYINRKSMLFVPFSITSVLVAIAGVMFFVQYVFICNQHTEIDDKPTNPIIKSSGDISKFLKFLGVVILWWIITVSSGITNGFASYISTFCVRDLQWTKFKGSLVSSLFNIFIVIGGLLGIPFTKCLNNTVYTGIQCVLISFSFIILLVCVHFDFAVGVWIASALFGYGKSVIMPLALSWSNEKFTIVTGRISSFYFFGALFGSIVNSQLVAVLMDKSSKLWFCYLFLIESFILMMLYVAISVVTCYRDKYHHPKNPKNVLTEHA